MWIGDIIKMAANARPKNEIVYNPSTWAGWTINGAITVDSTGAEWTCNGASAFSLTFPTNLKSSSKYGVILNVVSSSLNANFRIGAQYTGSYINIDTIVGLKKIIFTSNSTIENNIFVISNQSTNTAGTKIKIRDIRVFELPAGSQIEADFNTLTADQLNTLYPF